MNATCNTTNQTGTPKAEACDRASEHGYVSPGVNIYETKDGYTLEAELPGVTKEGLDIAIEGSTLTLTGRRTLSDLKIEPVYRESSKADYRRSFELDPAIDTTKVVAKLDQGVLTVTLPKAEQVKPRKVTVNG